MGSWITWLPCLICFTEHFLIFCTLGCHCSLVLREEEKKLKLKDLQMMARERRQFRVKITGVKIFVKGQRQFLTLMVAKHDMFAFIRRKLGLPSSNEKLTPHISVFEKKLL